MTLINPNTIIITIKLIIDEEEFDINKSSTDNPSPPHSTNLGFRSLREVSKKIILLKIIALPSTFLCVNIPLHFPECFPAMIPYLGRITINITLRTIAIPYAQASN